MINYPNVNQVWVAAGTYKPTVNPVDGSTNNRDKTFLLKKDVKIYGGFAGSETALEARDWKANPTILSGDLNNSNSIDNQDAYHVVVSVDDVGTAALDGFTITGGNANGSDFPIINSKNTPRNSGGGIFNINSSPILTNVNISGNSGGLGGGGGIYNHSSFPVLTNVTISGNSASTGGGIFNEKSSPTLTNVVISGNSVSGYGGGIYNNLSSPVLTNVTISGNSASTGGGIYNDMGCLPLLKNTVLWGNSSGVFNSGFSSSTYSHSLVQGFNDVSNGSNIDGNTNPQFINAPDFSTAPFTGGNYRLAACSPLIDKGDNSAISLDTDLAGNPRRYNDGIVDIGAYELNMIITDADLAKNTVTVSNTQTDDGATDYSDQCNGMVATIEGDGTENAVSGPVTIALTVAPTYLPKYVGRMYEITPQTNPETATATITLYYTQEEFNEYNDAQPNNTTKLPTDDTDAMGKSRILIIKVNGNDEVKIKPLSSVWNNAAARWEITFSVNGFSKFYLQGNNAALPLKLISFTAKEENCNALLQWSTAEEENVSHFEVEGSTDGLSFRPTGGISLIPAKNTSVKNNYTAIVSINSGVTYYRLKMVDIDGQFTYSNIATLNAQCFMQNISVYPNPAKEVLFIKSAAVGDVFRIYNAGGQLIKTGRIHTATQTVSLEPLAAGMYMLTVSSAEEVLKTQTKLVKE